MKSITWIVVSLMVVVGLVACGGGGGNNSDPAPATYSISGFVTKSGIGMQDVTMTLNSSVTATTDAGGWYSFTNLANGGTYTISASKTGEVFTPTIIVQLIDGRSITTANFTAY